MMDATWSLKQKAYFPTQKEVDNWMFKPNNDQEALAAETEAHFASAFARLATMNGLSKNDIHQLFPAVLRILKSKSEWAK